MRNYDDSAASIDKSFKANALQNLTSFLGVKKTPPNSQEHWFFSPTRVLPFPEPAVLHELLQQGSLKESSVLTVPFIADWSGISALVHGQPRPPLSLWPWCLQGYFSHIFTGWLCLTYREVIQLFYPWKFLLTKLIQG